jgi:hypothetical protein
MWAEAATWNQEARKEWVSVDLMEINNLGELGGSWRGMGEVGRRAKEREALQLRKLSGCEI